MVRPGGGAAGAAAALMARCPHPRRVLLGRGMRLLVAGPRMRCLVHCIVSPVCEEGTEPASGRPVPLAAGVPAVLRA